MCASSVLYTTFTATSTPASRWAGYQIIQGVGAGLGMQMSSLSVQLELRDRPELVPVGIALVMFAQYLGATVLQVVAGAVFNSALTARLEALGLTGLQMAALLGAGMKGMRGAAEEHVPLLLDGILEAYNAAITRVFVSLARRSRLLLLEHERLMTDSERYSSSPLAVLRQAFCWRLASSGP